MKLIGVLAATVVAIPLRYAPKGNCECPEAVKAFLKGEVVSNATGFLEVDDCCVEKLQKANALATVNSKEFAQIDLGFDMSSSTGSQVHLWPKKTPGHSCSQFTDCSSCTAYALCQWGGPHAILGVGNDAQYHPDYKCTDSYGIPAGDEDLYSNDCSSHINANTKPAEIVEDFSDMQDGTPFHARAGVNMTEAPQIIRDHDHGAWPTPFDGYLPAASMCAGSHYHENCGTPVDPHSMAYIKPHHYTDRPVVDFPAHP